MSGYFDDIQFIAGEEIPNCRVHVDRSFPGIYSFELILDGRMYFAVDGQKEEKILTAPTVHWHHPSHHYRYGPVDEKRGWHHLYLTFHGPRGRRIVENALMREEKRHFQTLTNVMEVLEGIRWLIAWINHGDLHRHPEAVARFELVVAQFTTGSEQRLQHRHELELREVIRTIHESPLLTPDAQSWAASMNLSPSHFRKIFREYTGMPFHTYCLRARMRHCAQLLARHPGYRIYEIAEMAGYQDPAQFSKLFRHYIGLSPRTYQHHLLRNRDHGSG
ncbi:MAG: AraC family transcriptional regulator [Lentisphaerae bacterium]|nr:MAG: AraC family transcriptional regulator [Lentisphaerota bacterium]